MDNAHMNAVLYLEKPFKVIKACSGGIRFSVAAIRRQSYRLHLLTKECPHTTLYTIYLNETSSLIDKKNNVDKKFSICNFYNQHYFDFSITWFNNVICVRRFNGPELVSYPEEDKKIDDIIGFVKFETQKENNNSIIWKIEIPQFIDPSITQPKHVDGGELRWVRMTKNTTLPVDALIGGFEYEPLYIARATHNGSLSPGKYLKSQRLAFIPWGNLSIPKQEFEILCGYDAVWVRANLGTIPENAFIGGYSEIGHEPLYIGRAWMDNNLIVGKVHLLHNKCYFPYLKVEMYNERYETLVTGNKVCRGERRGLPCYMKMDMQPCL